MVGSHLLTDGGVGYLDMMGTLGGEGVGGAILGIEVVEHVVLGIDVLTCSLQGSLVVSLVDIHVGLHGCGIIANGHDVCSGILGPYSAPVLTTHEVGLGE